MSKTITIIQLIHLVANDDKKPYQVKYEGNIYTWDCLNHYVDRKDGTSLFCSCVKDYRDFLTDEVEIIEEQEEIDIQSKEEIKEMEVFLSVDTRQTLEENLKKIDKHEVNFFFKINEIIRKQNKIVQYLEKLDKNIKEKQ